MKICPRDDFAYMKEEEIRPEKIFNKYLQLAESDVQKYFKIENRQAISCPACDSDGVQAFIKHGFNYQECPSCLTLFVSPRPSKEDFARYYEESDSAKYWASTFYKETAEARREKLWKPKANLIKEIVKQYATDNYRVIDIGGGFGIFAEEYEKISKSNVTVIEPGCALADECRDKGLEVVQNFLEGVEIDQLVSGSKAFVSFELFEHLHDPKIFLSHLIGLMESGDLFIFTTLSGTGVDIQALQENSKSVSPPHHINFFNPQSTKYLLEGQGFEVLKVSTPGKLDIDILYNNKDQIKDKFWRTFVIQSNDQEKEDMQTFIADSGFSSHMLVISRKP